MNRRIFLKTCGAGICSGLLSTGAHSPAHAADRLDLRGARACGFWDALTFSGTFEVTGAPPAAAIVARRITDLVGLAANFELREAGFDEGGTAFAVVKNERRFIVFDRARFDWRSGTPSWSEIAILAHEIGHHLNGHTIDDEGSNWQGEAEADWFAGFVIARLGGAPDDALALFRKMSARGSKTHPPRAMRLKSAEAGWRHGHWPGGVSHF